MHGKRSGCGCRYADTALAMTWSRSDRVVDQRQNRHAGHRHTRRRQCAQVYSFEGTESDTLALTVTGDEPLVVVITDVSGDHWRGQWMRQVDGSRLCWSRSCCG
jgi:hypothetical protein